MWAYFGTLTLVTILGDPAGLLSLPVQFTLKDQLGLGPQGLALFEVIIFIPVYLGFVFGFLRDRWRAWGQSDRGYLAIAALLSLPCYLWLAGGDVSFGSLLAAMWLAMVAYQMMDVSTGALLAAVAQRHSITGRLSAVVEVAEAVPGIVAVMLGGWMAAHTSLDVPLIAAAVCSLAAFGHTIWHPRGVFDSGPSPDVRERPRAALSRLLGHRPLRGAIAVAALWNLSIGWGTPYLFYVSDELHLSNEALGVCRAIGLASTLIVAPVYGVLCQRRTLIHNARTAILLGLLPGFLYLVVSTPGQAMAVAGLVGIPTAFGHMALFDLIRRACPPQLEGTAMTLAYSALALSVGAGDLMGAWLYDHANFGVCLAVDALANAAVLPVLAMLPVALISRRETTGEAPVAT